MKHYCVCRLYKIGIFYYKRMSHKIASPKGATPVWPQMRTQATGKKQEPLKELNLQFSFSCSSFSFLFIVVIHTSILLSFCPPSFFFLRWGIDVLFQMMVSFAELLTALLAGILSLNIPVATHTFQDQ